MTTPNVTRIELVWPDKGLVPVQDKSGRWSLTEPSLVTSLRSIPLRKRVAGDAAEGALSIAIVGSRLDALSAARRAIGRAVQLVYADIPRIEGFDETRAFLGVEGRTFTIWLSMVREHVRASRSLLVRGGVLAAQAGDLEAPFVRLILTEVFGRENYLGTALWRTHYSAKGGKDSNEIAAIHENIICFAFDKESVRKIALSVAPEGYANPDGDPRLEWEARQKDAGRDTVKLTYNVPPYRWSLVKGRLPRGLWRVSPMSGVIWGTPKEFGRFRVTVRVEDSAGKGSERQLSLEIVKQGDADPRPDHVWWMLHPPKPTKSPPRITTENLPTGCVDKEYSAILMATGGAPHTGSPRPSRGWAFGQTTLALAILEDRCSFGKKGTAIPETKKYLRDLEGGLKLINLTSWWDDVALSQDSTKHQNALHDAGLIQKPVLTAKPELLLARVVDALAPRGSLLLELFSRSGDLAAVALKTGRRFLTLLGDSDLDREFAAQCALPRLEAVVTGTELAKVPASDDKHADFLRVSGGGGFRVLEVGPAIATKIQGEEQFRLSMEEFQTEMDMMEAILTSEGFFVCAKMDGRMRGVSWDGTREAVILDPREFLDQATAAEFASSMKAGAALAVYYFRSADDFAPEEMQGGVSFRRVPSELAT